MAHCKKKHYTYEYDKVVFETDAENPDNNVWNVHGINLVSKKICGEMFYCMYNGHADITAMISENGETAEKYYYDEWGKETETSKYGDMTGDGKVTVNDYSLLKKHLYIEPLELTSDQKKAADLNADGKVDTSDLNTLKQILFGEKKYCEADTNRDGFINEKNSIKYAGYYYDAETRLYYLNARFYDPETARFIQQDSYSGNIYDPLSLNLYVYSNNNPISYYDPTGHFFDSIKKSFTNTVNKAKESIKSKANDFKESVENTLNNIKSGASNIRKSATNIAKEFSEDWNSGIDQLKQSGTAGKIFASYSEGAVNSLSNMGKGAVKLVSDPLGTVSESVSYFLEDPLMNNPVSAILLTQYDIETAIICHDYETAAYKLGGLTSDIAVAGITGGVTKGIAGKITGKLMPEGIHINKTLEFKNPFSPRYAVAGGLEVCAGTVSIPISIEVSAAASAKMAGGVVTAAAAQNIVYSKTLSGQSDGGEVSTIKNECHNNVKKEVVSPYDLEPTHNQTKSRRQMDKFLKDVQKDGTIRESIKYVEYNGKKYVVDGHHRLIAAKKLGIKNIPAEKVNLPYGGYKTIDDLNYDYY